jgi:hypothetical protein
MTDYWTSQMKNHTRFAALLTKHTFQNVRFLDQKIDFADTRQKSIQYLTPPFLLVAFLLIFSQSSQLAVAAPGSRVTFNDEGITLVDGKPFFPIGVFTYNIDPTVLAELHEVQCNTVLNGFNPDQLDLLHQHGLMAVCHTSDDWIKAAINHPALLAWYLTDEPENRGVTPEGEQKRYGELKKKDPNHPIGLCHTSFEALTHFKAACDFTMTDIYPITKNRDTNVMGVAIMMEEARRLHGQNWPHWTDIQTFGGPESDNGVWAVPLPHEVRFMVYQALVHRATGILYFSYWPQQPRTWQSLAPLNREIHRLVPRLVSPGKDTWLTVDDGRIQARLRTATSGKSGLVIAVNTSTKFVQTTLHFENVKDKIEAPFENRSIKPTEKGELLERFAPYAEHVYTWGPDPVVELAREQ